MKNFIFKIDHYIAKLFHNMYLWGGDFTNNLMEGISLIAEAGILFLIVGLGLALFKRTRKAGATIILSIALGFLITNIILKNSIARARPFEDINSDFFKWWLGAGAVSESGFSFPSGHTTATTAFAVALFLSFNKKYSWPVLFLPLVMASSRIYLMVHYFSDCVGGLLVGTSAAVIAFFICKWIYTSKIKLFVWARELDLFKSKRKKQTSSNTETVKVENPAEDYVYSTQEQENQSSNIENSLIQQDIESKEKQSLDK